MLVILARCGLSWSCGCFGLYCWLIMILEPRPFGARCWLIMIFWSSPRASAVSSAQMFAAVIAIDTLCLLFLQCSIALCVCKCSACAHQTFLARVNSIIFNFSNFPHKAIESSCLSFSYRSSSLRRHSSVVRPCGPLQLISRVVSVRPARRRERHQEFRFQMAPVMLAFYTLPQRASLCLDCSALARACRGLPHWFLQSFRALWDRSPKLCPKRYTTPRCWRASTSSRRASSAGIGARLPRTNLVVKCTSVLTSPHSVFGGDRGRF